MALIETLFPGLVARYWMARERAKLAQRLYKAAQPSNYHPSRGDPRSGNAVMEHARHKLAYWGRYLEENSDLVVGALDDLVDRVVGAGIKVQPLPKRLDGTVHEPLAEAMRRAFDDWSRRCDTSGVQTRAEVERLLCRSHFRDGEVLYKHVRGVRGFRYRSVVPYVVEPLEADWLPFDLILSDRGEDGSIIHGIERDQYGTILAYYLLRQHPGEFLFPLRAESLLAETDRIQVEDIEHLRVVRRLGQLRGVTILHSCVHRMQDLDDYEESERLAAKLAASFSAAITKSPDVPGQTLTTTSQGDRSFEMQTAMVFDKLLPGESIETIAPNRPSNALLPYREAMLKAVSAGTGARYSTIARTWESSYTAMRQETVAMETGSRRMQGYFVDKVTRTLYENWLNMALLTDTFDVAGADRLSLFDADYMGPVVPWLDPLDEAQADILLKENGIKSRQQIIKERGYDQRRVDAELEMDTFEPVEATSQEPADA